MSSSLHAFNEKKDILILGEGLKQRLGNIALTTEKNYLIIFTENNHKFCLSLSYN